MPSVWLALSQMHFPSSGTSFCGTRYQVAKKERREFRKIGHVVSFAFDIKQRGKSDPAWQRWVGGFTKERFKNDNRGNAFQVSTFTLRVRSRLFWLSHIRSARFAFWSADRHEVISWKRKTSTANRSPCDTVHWIHPLAVICKAVFLFFVACKSRAASSDRDRQANRSYLRFAV